MGSPAPLLVRLAELEDAVVISLRRKVLALSLGMTIQIVGWMYVFLASFPWSLCPCPKPISEFQVVKLQVLIHQVLALFLETIMTVSSICPGARESVNAVIDHGAWVELARTMIDLREAGLTSNGRSLVLSKDQHDWHLIEAPFRHSREQDSLKKKN
jgi:hypothetical protein